MAQIIRHAAPIALLFAISGCGTLLNLDNKERYDFSHSDMDREPGRVYGEMRYQRPAFVFGGIANDIAWIRSAQQPTDVVGAIIDMPFSAVGDIVTLPYVAYKRVTSQSLLINPDPQAEWQKFWFEDSPNKRTTSNPEVREGSASPPRPPRFDLIALPE